MLADRDAGACRVEQAHRLVGQLARRDVAVRQLDRRLDRLVEQLHAMVLLEHAGHAAQHQDRLELVGLGHLNHLEAPVSAGSFSMCFLYSAQVVAPMVRSVPRASAGLSRLAASPVPAAPPAPTRVWTSSMKRMIGFGLAAPRRSAGAGAARTRPSSTGAGLQQAEVEREERDALQLRRHVAARRRCAKPSTTAVLPTPGLAGEDRIVLAAPHQDVDDLADLVVASGDGPFPPFSARAVRSTVYFLIASCLPIAAGAIAPVTSPGWPPDRPLPSCGPSPCSPVLPTSEWSSSAKSSTLILPNSFEMPRAHCADAASSACRAAGSCSSRRRRRTAASRRPSRARWRRESAREVGETRSSRAAAGQRARYIARQRRRVERVVADDGVDVRGVVLEQLRHPVDSSTYGLPRSLQNTVAPSIVCRRAG
jgi:hypothetical protein